jgi:hypothetical protein
MSAVEVWIDGYPQTCVSALAWLKTSLLPGKGSKQACKRPAQPRNAARDAWVERQRAKKTPLTWAEIYDEGVRLAAKRGWDMPGSPKALEEAHRRYLRQQRPAMEE